MNLESALQLFAKYLPVVIGIVQREWPMIEAAINDFKALQAGQTPNAVVPQALINTQWPPQA